MGKSEEKRPLGIQRCIWEDNIKMDLREIRWGGMDCIHLMGCHEHGNEVSDSIKG
jgi:hypothetical protein